MPDFKGITLNFDMQGSFYYSSKFKNILIKELREFTDKVVAVAKSKYEESPIILSLLSSFSASVDNLEKNYENLKKDEKSVYPDYDKIINIRYEFSKKIFGDLCNMSNMIYYSSEGDMNGIKYFTGEMPSGATKEDLKKELEKLKKDEDYHSSSTAWGTAIEKVNDLIAEQSSNLMLPFPDYRLNKKIFEKNPLWKSACEKEFISLFTSLLNGIKPIDNKYSDLKILLNNIFGSAQNDILKIYENYKPYRLSKLSKISSKDAKDKVVFARLTFLKSLSYATVGFQKNLTHHGYKSHPFVIFLKFLKKKCEDDKKLVNKL